MPLSDGWLEESIAVARSAASVKAWRAVEAQHIVSTLRLVDNDPEQQDLLEQILEESKSPLPRETKGLHYLLATPFRYPPAHYGSRFRAWPDPGVLYAAYERRTACAEMGYWRWRFISESEGLQEIAASPQTLFQVGARGSSIDLQRPPFDARDASEKSWTDPADYGATQALARAAREAGIHMILYRSVRDPGQGVCVAVLQPAGLRPKRPITQETWHLTVTARSAIWTREKQRFSFRFG